MFIGLINRAAISACTEANEKCVLLLERPLNSSKPKSASCAASSASSACFSSAASAVKKSKAHCLDKSRSDSLRPLNSSKPKSAPCASSSASSARFSSARFSSVVSAVKKSEAHCLDKSPIDLCGKKVDSQLITYAQSSASQIIALAFFISSMVVISGGAIRKDEGQDKNQKPINPSSRHLVTTF